MGKPRRTVGRPRIEPGTDRKQSMSVYLRKSVWARVETYRRRHGIRSTSQAVEEALGIYLPGADLEVRLETQALAEALTDEASP